MIILDTCILIDGLEGVTEPAGISVMSPVELQLGITAATAPQEERERQERYASVLERFKPLPVDSKVLRELSIITAAVKAVGRQSSSRMVDLLIAATAASRGWAVLTDNLDDFAGLEGLVEVRAPRRG